MLQFQWLDSIAQVAASEWDSLLGKQTSPCHRHGWLAAMELSGSIAPSTGWHASHLLVREGDGSLVAAAVAYGRSNSWGDYVYDFAWADLAKQMGQTYYPKLVATIPATPSADYRFLMADETRREELSLVILTQLQQRVSQLGCHSLHALFVERTMESALEDQNMLAWTHHRYAWRNRQWSDFEDYLAVFGKNQRRNIKRERQSVQDAGIFTGVVTMEQLSQPQRKAWAAHMAELYYQTNQQFGPWAARFLNHEFFARAVVDCADFIVFAWASRNPNLLESPDEVPMAMTFMFRGNGYLYGRFWGTQEFHPDLHFELCYYRPIEWCIQEGIEIFDPGAGSPHKIRRGFVAEETRSFHRYYNPDFHALFSQYMPQINEQEQEQIQALNLDSPLRR